ncbi:ABC transporter permease [Halobacillus locisalis]|uniref:ABC transporter permease n=1 Tax=Halobacillus locisalis TaxID=220753 RepID=A0A838CVB7_9BACI|nr:ABC transporter permease [Halobacillus locisalis]MBA2175884.1 ABC transporter permease [Halobacillus locisalis]
MKRIWTLATFEWKRMFKKPQSYLIMFGMPLLFTFVFGALFSGEGGESELPLVGIVDQDQSNVSTAFVHRLEESELMETAEMSLEEAVEYLSDQSITGYIAVDASFEEVLKNGELPDVTMAHLPAFQGASTLTQWIDSQMRGIAVKAEAASHYQSLTGKDWGESFAVMDQPIPLAQETIKMVNVSTSETVVVLDNMTARATGFAVMFVMIAMLSSTGVLLEARQSGVWYRLISTPARKVEIIFGYLLAFFLIGWVQFGVLMVASSLIFGVYWGSILGNAALVSALLLCTIGLGLFIAGFVQTTEQQAIYGNLIIFSTCMVAGVYWPVEIMPEFMQRIADFVPQTWALEGFAELSARAGTFTDILLPIAILLGFTVLFLSVGMKRMRFE